MLLPGMESKQEGLHVLWALQQEQKKNLDED